jgi:hypothetical protein
MRGGMETAVVKVIEVDRQTCWIQNPSGKIDRLAPPAPGHIRRELSGALDAPPYAHSRTTCPDPGGALERMPAQGQGHSCRRPSLSLPRR